MPPITRQRLYSIGTKRPLEPIILELKIVIEVVALVSDQQKVFFSSHKRSPLLWLHSEILLCVVAELVLKL